MEKTESAHGEADFFGSDLLTLLARCEEETLSAPLVALRFQVLSTLNESLCPATRAEHAQNVAATLYSRYCCEGIGGSFDVAEDYCLFAVRLGRVEAYCLQIKIVLHEEERQIDESGLLPFVMKKGGYASADATGRLRQVWRDCIYHTLKYADGIETWSVNAKLVAYDCALAHITCRDASSRTSQARRDSNIACDGRWALPLLEKLAEALNGVESRREGGSDAHRKLQIAAARVLCEDAARKGDEMLHETTDQDQGVVKPGAAGWHVVIKGAIAPSQDRDDKPFLAQYECLRSPLPLAAMPDIERLDFVHDTLTAEFPWAYEAIDSVLSEMTARKRAGSAVLGMMPTLLVGPPGSGKTRLSQRLSDLLGLPNVVIGMAGMVDQKVLKGSARGWASARPSRIVEFLMQEKAASSLFLLDEVDKAPITHQGWAQEVLLDLVEPRNARRFSDIFLMAECDLSNCMYVMTSNSVERISKPLLSRLQLAFVPMPEPVHAEVIVRGVLADLGREWGLPDSDRLMLEHVEIQTLTGLAPREMRRAIIKMLSSDWAAQRYARH